MSRELNMVNSFEVPAEMRDFAERSVSQARKAFEGFIGAVHKSTGVLDTSANPALGGVKDVSTKAVGFAEKNVAAAFDLGEKLVHAKDFNEVVALQSDYLKAQMAAIQEQAREFGDVISKAATVKK
jgi:phasin